jgi:uncharacterized protein (TIGR02147 family)
MKSHKSILEFDDYRLYLLYRYGEMRKTNSSFSMRAMSQYLGCKSLSHFGLITSKRQNLSEAFVAQFSKKLNLLGKEKRYFKLLVLYNQAKLPDKIGLLSQLNSLKASVPSLLEKSQLEYLGNWYNPVVREYLQIHSIKKGEIDFGMKIVPRITKKQVQASIELLEKLDLIYENDAGFLKPNDALVSSGPKPMVSTIKEYFNQNLNLAQGAIDLFPKEEKNFSTLVLSLDKKTQELVTEELRQARQNIMRLVHDCKTPNRVLQVSLQVFPMTKLEN